MTGCNDMGLPVPTVIHGVQCHLSTRPLQLSWVPPAQQSGRKLAVEKLRNKYIPGCVCALMGAALQWQGWSLAVSHMGAPLLILGHPPGGGWHPLFVPWDWLMFSSTVGQNRGVCWCAGGMIDFSWSSFSSVTRCPLVWSLSWMTLFNFSPFFQMCWGNIPVLQGLLLSVEHILFQETDWDCG